MNKKLALLSGSLLLANLVFGETKNKDTIDLDDMAMPEEVSADTPKKSPNPFLKQEKKLVKHFSPKKSNDIFDLHKEDPFMDTDPWDD